MGRRHSHKVRKKQQKPEPPRCLSVDKGTDVTVKSVHKRAEMEPSALGTSALQAGNVFFLSLSACIAAQTHTQGCLEHFHSCVLVPAKLPGRSAGSWTLRARATARAQRHRCGHSSGMFYGTTGMEWLHRWAPWAQWQIEFGPSVWPLVLVAASRAVMGDLEQEGWVAHFLPTLWEQKKWGGPLGSDWAPTGACMAEADLGRIS